MVQSLRVGRYGSIAVDLWLWVGYCGLVTVGRSLWVSCCGFVAVDRSLRADCYGSVAVGRSLWVGSYDSVARRLLWVSLRVSGSHSDGKVEEDDGRVFIRMID